MTNRKCHILLLVVKEMYLHESITLSFGLISLVVMSTRNKDSLGLCLFYVHSILFLLVLEEGINQRDIICYF